METNERRDGRIDQMTGRRRERGMHVYNALEALDDDGPEHPEGHEGAAHGGHPHPGLLEALLVVGWLGVGMDV